VPPTREVLLLAPINGIHTRDSRMTIRRLYPMLGMMRSAKLGIASALLSFVNLISQFFDGFRVNSYKDPGATPVLGFG
jgi:hypothetical protein